MKWGSGVVGPFVFENERGVTQTVNTERYVDTALKLFWKIKQRERMGMKRVRTQQDGATARESMAWLHDHFPGRLISLKGCAPHSPGLSPLHVFSGTISRLGFTRRRGESTNTRSSQDHHHSRSRPSVLWDDQQARQSPADRPAAGANPPDGGSHRAPVMWHLSSVLPYFC